MLVQKYLVIIYLDLYAIAKHATRKKQWRDTCLSLMNLLVNCQLSKHMVHLLPINWTERKGKILFNRDDYLYIVRCVYFYWFIQILNLNDIFPLLEAINHAAEVWGIRCLRYEIRKCNSTVYCISKKGWGMVSLFQRLDFWSQDQDWDALCVVLSHKVLNSHRTSLDLGIQMVASVLSVKPEKCWMVLAKDQHLSEVE